MLRISAVAFFLTSLGSSNFAAISAQTSFEPIQDLRVVYNQDQCPQGFEPLAGHRVGSDLEVQLPADLNAGTNGNSVRLCYQRGSDPGKAIHDVAFYSDPTTPPGCPSGWETVLEEETQTPADFNEGASVTWFWFWHVKRYITMCYRPSSDVSEDPVYQLRLLNRRQSEPREFEVKDQDLNADVLGERQYLAVSRSPSMLAAAIAFAGTGNDPDFTFDWAEAIEESATGDVTVNFRLHCQKDGGPDIFNACAGRTDMTDDEFDRLCALSFEGMAYYWSGPVTLDGVTRLLTVTFEETSQAPNKDADICVRGEEFGDGSSFKRSQNIEGNIIDMTIWYNKGFFPSQEIADDYFKETSAHEIGHSILLAASGLVHTATHKGTSTILSEYSADTPMCPATGDLDVMKYYSGGSCEFERWNTTNWDRAKVIMMASTYAIV